MEDSLRERDDKIRELEEIIAKQAQMMKGNGSSKLDLKDMWILILQSSYFSDKKWFRFITHNHNCSILFSHYVNPCISSSHQFSRLLVCCQIYLWTVLIKISKIKRFIKMRQKLMLKTMFKITRTNRILSIKS